MAMMLLVGGGLLIHSFVKLANVNPGYDAADVLTFQVALPPDRYPNARVKTFADDLVARLRQVPGVDAAGFARQLPMVILTDSLSLSRSPSSPQAPKPDDSTPIIRAYFRVVSQDYLDSHANSSHPGTVHSITTTATASRVRSSSTKRWFAARLPARTLSGSLSSRRGTASRWEIVGVVRDVRQFALDRDPAPQIFADFRQWPEKEVPLFPLGPYYLVRTKRSISSQVMPVVRAIVGQLDGQAAPYNVAAIERHRVRYPHRAPSHVCRPARHLRRHRRLLWRPSAFTG